jgi:chaperonin GroES
MISELETEVMEHRNHKVHKLRDHLRPTEDWIFCTNTRRSNRIGRLWVPDSCREDLQQGDVVAVGPGKLTEWTRLKMTVKVGDRVLWAKHWQKDVDISDDEKYAAVREKDVIGIVTDEGKRLIPLYNTVVVKMDPLPEREGSLWLPQQVKKELMPPMAGTVVDIGEGHLFSNGSIIPMEVKKGQRILVNAFAGEDHSFGEEVLRLVPEEHVVAIIEE